MHFDYEEAFGIKPPEAYGRLFLDVMHGDQTLFARQDWLESAWQFLDPILDRWRQDKDKGLYPYAAGSWGPAASEDLLAKDGNQWLIS